MTANELISSATQVVPDILTKGMSAPGMRVIKFSHRTDIGTKRRVFYSTIMSQQDSRAYNQIVEFYKFKDPEKELPNLAKHQVRVRCSCPMFFFWFAYPNYKNRALSGPPPRKYTPVPASRRKRAPGPPKNPEQRPGVCKHLVRLFIILKDERLATS